MRDQTLMETRGGTLGPSAKRAICSQLQLSSKCAFPPPPFDAGATKSGQFRSSRGEGGAQQGGEWWVEGSRSMEQLEIEWRSRYAPLNASLAAHNLFRGRV
jgi:hypothetical protein